MDISAFIQDIEPMTGESVTLYTSLAGTVVALIAALLTGRKNSKEIQSASDSSRDSLLKNLKELNIKERETLQADLMAQLKAEREQFNTVRKEDALRIADAVAKADECQQHRYQDMQERLNDAKELANLKGQIKILLQDRDKNIVNLPVSVTAVDSGVSAQVTPVKSPEST